MKLALLSHFDVWRYIVLHKVNEKQQSGYIFLFLKKKQSITKHNNKTNQTKQTPLQ